MGFWMYPVGGLAVCTDQLRILRKKETRLGRRGRKCLTFSRMLSPSPNCHSSGSICFTMETKNILLLLSVTIVVLLMPSCFDTTTLGREWESHETMLRQFDARTITIDPGHSQIFSDHIKRKSIRFYSQHSTKKTFFFGFLLNHFLLFYRYVDFYLC